MRGSKAKMLRKAAEYTRHQHPTEYEKLQLLKPMAMPSYETYTRVVREMGPVVRGETTNLRMQRHHGPFKARRNLNGDRRHVVSHEVTKIRYRSDGKTPAKLMVDEKGKPTPIFIPIAKSIRLKAGSPRRVYQTLKYIARTMGLTKAYKELQEAV